MLLTVCSDRDDLKDSTGYVAPSRMPFPHFYRLKSYSYSNVRLKCHFLLWESISKCCDFFGIPTISGISAIRKSRSLVLLSRLFFSLYVLFPLMDHKLLRGKEQVFVRLTVPGSDEVFGKGLQDVQFWSKFIQVLKSWVQFLVCLKSECCSHVRSGITERTIIAMWGGHGANRSFSPTN